MIYVIRNINYDIDKNELVDLIKIGYTDDKSKDIRFSAYKLHNPLCKIIYTIPEGTMEDEKNLHYKFKVYKLKDYGNEWFYYNLDIIHYFNTHTTKESLSDLIPKINENNKHLSEINKTIKIILDRWFHLKYNKDKQFDLEKYKEIKNKLFNLVKINKILNDSDIFEYLKYDFGITDEEILDIKNYSSKFLNNDNIKQFLDEFDKLPTFRLKMKYLCESPEVNDFNREVILDQLPLTYRQYYEVLGNDRCKSLGYNITRLKKELSDIKLDENVLKNLITVDFKVGEKYTKEFIKQKLQEIYNKIGYNKTAKAIDLESYFYLKDAKITNQVTNKRENGFEIVKEK